MTIFTKPIDEVRYQDVIEFCKKLIPEGVHLDYKGDFPSGNEKLAKTIAAFANTWGGVLIIGVEDEDSKPKPPFVGIQYRDKLHEKVEDIVFDHIRPPIFGEIQVAPNEEKSKAFIVIRIPQSNDAHVLNKDGAVYIRTGRSSRPEEVASPEQIGWLMDRRKKSLELREWIRSKAEERFSNFCRLHCINKGELSGICSLSIIPLYPQKPLVKYQEIPPKKIAVYSSFFRDSFPYHMDRGTMVQVKRTVQGGISYFEVTPSEPDSVHFWELDHFGLFLHKMEVVQAKKGKILEINKIVVLVCLFLKVALNFYRELGYWGLLEFRFQVENIFNLKPDYPLGAGRLPAPVVDNNLNVSREFNFRELEDSLENICIEILHEIFWSIHLDDTDGGYIKELIRKLEPHLFNGVKCEALQHD